MAKIEVSSEFGLEALGLVSVFREYRLVPYAVALAAGCVLKISVVFLVLLGTSLTSLVVGEGEGLVSSVLLVSAGRP